MLLKYSHSGWKKKHINFLLIAIVFVNIRVVHFFYILCKIIRFGEVLPNTAWANCYTIEDPNDS